MPDANRLTGWKGLILFVWAGLFVPAVASSQTVADAQKAATVAQAEATAALALARSTAAEFAAPIAGAPADMKAAAESARQSAESAGDAAVAAGIEAVALANAADAANPASIANALAAAHAAEAAAQRASAAVESARAAFYNVQAAFAKDATASKNAGDSNKESAAHYHQALLHDVEAAAQARRVIDLNGTPDVRYLRALAQNQQAETHLALAVSQAAIVPSANVPAPPAPGKIFQIDGGKFNSFHVNYNLRRHGVVSDVVNGTPRNDAGLSITPVNLAVAPPRITINLVFKHGKSDDLTIPRIFRVRLNFDGKAYKAGADDLKTISRDFIVVMNEIDGTLTVGNPIENSVPATIVILDDDLNEYERLSGAFEFAPSLVNARN